MRFNLAVKFDGNGGLEEIKFSGHGCAISQASASLMTTKLKGKSRADVEQMLHAFLRPGDDRQKRCAENLGDLQVMRGVRKFPQRVKCAMLPWRAVEPSAAQSEGEATVSTARHGSIAHFTRCGNFRTHTHHLKVAEIFRAHRFCRSSPGRKTRATFVRHQRGFCLFSFSINDADA